MDRPLSSINFINTNISQPQSNCQTNHANAERGNGSEDTFSRHQSQSTAAHYSPNMNQNQSSAEPPNPKITIEQSNLQPLPIVENELNVLRSSVINVQQKAKENITTNDDFESKLTNADASTQHSNQRIQPVNLIMFSETIDEPYSVEISKELKQNVSCINLINDASIIDLVSDDEKC